MLQRLLALVHEHGQEISRLPRPSHVRGAHISKSDDSDKVCVKIGRSVSQRSRMILSHGYRAFTCASVASVCGNQKVISIA